MNVSSQVPGKGLVSQAAGVVGAHRVLEHRGRDDLDDQQQEVEEQVLVQHHLDTGKDQTKMSRVQLKLSLRFFTEILNHLEYCF